MAHNTYVRNGSVKRFYDGTYRVALLYGEKKFDPHAMIVPHGFLYGDMGRSGEMILHIAGVTHYPTPKGYERIERK